MSNVNSDLENGLSSVYCRSFVEFAVFDRDNLYDLAFGAHHRLYAKHDRAFKQSYKILS